MFTSSAGSSPVPGAPPKSFGTCMRMIVAPTPEMNPPITGEEMYFTTRPAFTSQNTRNHAPVRSARIAAISIASAVPSVSPMAVSAAPVMTAGIASTPTTNCGDDVTRPKSRIGSREP